MISMKDYLGVYANSKDLTPERQANAQRLLKAVNSLIMQGMKDKILFLDNPRTKCQIAGEKNGGFRPQDCPIGAPNSAHKEGLAVDLYDPVGAIDRWLMDSPTAMKKYEELGLYFEAPASTIGWSHWSLKRPPSGKRFFIP